MMAIVFVGFAVMIVAAVFGALALAKGTQNKTRWGVNLTPPTACPQCGEPLPSVRVPASFREAMWGGWTCKRCGHAIDKWGRPRV